MFDTNVYIEASARRVDEVTYEVSSHVPYYRSIPLSMINDIRLSVNDTPVAREDIKISPDDVHWFTLDESRTVTFHKWEYGVPLRVQFKSDDELGKDVKLRIACIARTAYIPVPLHGELEVMVNFE